MISYLAPGKLNLFLHIVGRRADGYHLLQTVFQFINYGDTLYFERRTDGAITRQNGPEAVPAELDLTIRAARLLQQTAGGTAGVTLRLDKRLPIGGGLGGGSSDAATTLVVLNRLWDLHWSTARLAALGVQLGADVPVFVHGQTAWGEGVGERLTPLDLPEPWYLLLFPAVKVSTAAIFSAPDLTRNTPPITITDFLCGQGHNDCEALVRRRYPEIDRVLTWLGERADARLTGTGATVFARFESEPAARALLAEAPSEWRGVVVRGMNRSPLREMLNDEEARAQPE